MRLERVLLLCIASIASSFAQPPTPQSSPSAAMKAADPLFTSGKWEEAARAYGEIARSEPQNGRAWARLGISLHALGKYSGAVAALEKAVIDLKFNQPPVMYRLARAYAKAGERDKALDWLNKTMDAGFQSAQLVGGDKDLDTLRNDPRYAPVGKKIEEMLNPCKHRPEYRQLDFWIGEWDFFGTAGQPAGGSKIDLTLNDCVILEDYSGQAGYEGKALYEGKAFHFYDAANKRWELHYIDTLGLPWNWIGEFKEGVLTYTRESDNPDGSKTFHRMSISRLANGNVRQFYETSTDGGKTWTTGLDGRYVPRIQNAR